MTVAHLKERMDARFTAVDKRFEAVDARFDAIDARFDRLTVRMDGQFSSMNEKLTTILVTLDKKYRHLEKAIDVHEKRIMDLEPPTI